MNLSMHLRPDAKKGILIAVTGFVVGYVRHGVNEQWASWDSIEQILGYWLIHTIALLLFMLFGSAIILSRYEFFLGRKLERSAEEEVPLIVVMTVFLAAVAIFLMAHWPATGDDY